MSETPLLKKASQYISWIQRGFKALFCRETENAFGRLLWAIRFGFGGPIRLYLRFLGRISDFRPVNLILGQNSCRTKVPRIFEFFVPDFAPNFAPNFPRNFRGFFRASFRGKRRPEKIHQKSPLVFNAKFPGKSEKKIHPKRFTGHAIDHLLCRSIAIISFGVLLRSCLRMR